MLVETRMNGGVIESLEAMGHKIRPVGEWAIGDATAIRIDPGRGVVSEPRGPAGTSLTRWPGNARGPAALLRRLPPHRFTNAPLAATSQTAIRAHFQPGARHFH